MLFDVVHKRYRMIKKNNTFRRRMIKKQVKLSFKETLKPRLLPTIFD